jgi:hypothetical protein
MLFDHIRCTLRCSLGENFALPMHELISLTTNIVVALWLTELLWLASEFLFFEE